MVFLLSSAVQSHGSSVWCPILHVHHAGFLYVLNGLWHLLLFLLQSKHKEMSGLLCRHFTCICPLISLMFKQQAHSPSSSYQPVQWPWGRGGEVEQNKWFLCVLLVYYRGYKIKYLLCSMKKPGGNVKEITKQSQITAVSCHTPLDRAERIRLVFCVIFSFLQVSILCLVILLGVLEAHS